MSFYVCAEVLAYVSFVDGKVVQFSYPFGHSEYNDDRVYISCFISF